MKKILLSAIFLSSSFTLMAQDVNIKVAQTSYSDIDPDGAGPATGSVVIRFELQTTSGTILADAIGFIMAFQSTKLMPTPTNTTVKAGPLASAATVWTQNVDNRAGNIIVANYGGQNFDRRMVILFSEPVGNPNVAATTTYTSWMEVTYWTLGSSYPQGGFVTPEPGSIVPASELSSDQGGTLYPLLTPELNTPVPLGGSLPVSFTKSSVTCSPSGASIVWGTGSESNSSHFEVLKSTDGGNNWVMIDRKTAAGNSVSERQYQSLDIEAGTALYKIRQVDRDGRSSETAILRSTCEVKNAITSLLYPVPANNILTLVVKQQKMLKTTLQIIDAKGRLVQQREATLTPGSNKLDFNVSTLAAGEYMLFSSNPELKLNKKFVVAR